MIIRPATRSDITAMADLLAELFAVESDFTSDIDRQFRGLSLMIDGCPDRCCVRVAEIDGSVVGMATGQAVISTAEGGPAVLVEDVVVSREHQGRGLGPKLLNDVIAWARDRGATRLQLLADVDNTHALAFYRHMGWAQTRLICLRKHP